MSKKNNHPLEELLDLEEGSTPRYDPLASSTENQVDGESLDDSDPSESMFDILDTMENSSALTESDSTDLYEIDDSIEKVMDSMPKEEPFYDRIDQKVEDKYQQIYNYSIEAYSRQMQDAEVVEGKYKARNSEVAAQFLRIALDSAKDSGNQKANKDKVKLAEKKVDHDMGNKGKGNTNNNYFIGDTNDLLKAIEDAKSSSRTPKVINVEKEEDQ